MNAKQLEKLSFRLLKLAQELKQAADKKPDLKDLAQGADSLWCLSYRLKEAWRVAELRAKEGAELLYTIFEPGDGWQGTVHERTPGRIIRTTFFDPTSPRVNEHAADVFSDPWLELGRAWSATDLAEVRKRTDRTMPAWGARAARAWGVAA